MVINIRHDLYARDSRQSVYRLICGVSDTQNL